MKNRIDQLLVERGLADDAAKAAALVMAGKVYSGTRRLDKAGEQIKNDAPLHVKGKEHPYVSRGGVKLAAALDYFNINPSGMVALDIGASTGGFTDVLLQRGARKVYAVDVGTNQLDYRLRQNNRVVVLEQTDARHVTPALIPDAPDIIVCDASFITLASVLPAALKRAHQATQLVALIKPQFELPTHEVGEGGIVRDEALHKKACSHVQRWLADAMGWQVQGLHPSPILGAQGNREFLIAGVKS